jgi:galactokinase
VSDVVQQAMLAFRSRYGGEPDTVVRAPGRVNLIGEHTDYNEGFVLPAAIDRWVVFACRRRPDSHGEIWSAAHEELYEFPTDVPPERTGEWPDYPLGVLLELQKLGLAGCGFEGAIAGDVPVGAGLSSSAAVEMAVARCLLDLNGRELSGPETALLGQRAENGFVGVNCGIMDQFISANGSAGHALFLDCRDLAYQLVPVSEEDCRIVICNSGVKRGLTSSGYNQRRAACEDGVRRLAAATGQPIRALRDVSGEMLDASREALSESTYRRCRHVVGEIERTQQAAALLRSGNMAGFGRLMDESHVSLRDDYEVSGPELDLLVQIASGVPGVLGARMTGAGFGGCTVNLVSVDAVAPLEEAIRRDYPDRAGLEPEVYVCSAVNGAESVA